MTSNTSPEKKITVQWLDEDQIIIHQIFRQEWTLKDYEDSLLEAYALLDSVEHAVYLITTVKGKFKMPPGFKERLKQSSADVRANERLHSIVLEQGRTNTLTELVLQMTTLAIEYSLRDKTRLRFCFKHEEALNIIQKHRDYEKKLTIFRQTGISKAYHTPRQA